MAGTAPTASDPYAPPTAPAYGAFGRVVPYLTGSTGPVERAQGTSPTSGKFGTALGSAINQPPKPDATIGAIPSNQYGTESGPGIMQQWFGQRATGTDPGWEYEMRRAGTALNNQYAARGMYNSGAATQGLGDMYAGAVANREGQLDQLAGGASAERANQLTTMLGLGTGLAGGQAGLGAAYDTSAANAMSGANSLGLQLGTQAAMIPYMANQQTMNQLFGLGTLAALA